MIKNYRVPKTKEPFDLNETLRALSQNKHNDSTTTYYLLHKKYMKTASNPEEHMVKLTFANHEQIAYKINNKEKMTQQSSNQSQLGMSVKSLSTSKNSTMKYLKTKRTSQHVLPSPKKTTLNDHNNLY